MRQMIRWTVISSLLLVFGCASGPYSDCRRASEELCTASLLCEPEFSFPGAGTYVCPAGYPEAIPRNQCSEALTYACVQAR